MNYRLMEEMDFESVVTLYVDYYNSYEKACWTHETAHKRIHKVYSRESAYCLVIEDENTVIGCIVGCFRQYDDLVTYDLDEIVIAAKYQNKGMGTAAMIELEQRVKCKGAAMIQLQAVNDKMHRHFYGKLEYKDATNLVLKAKWL